MKPFILYHWSPASRRKSILKHGLCPKKVSRCGQWRPPYLCFSDSPSYAWSASAALSDQPEEWDLWMVWSSALKGGVERLYLGTNDKRGPAEFRLYDQRVPKRLIWFVGSRTVTPRRRRSKS